MEKLGTTAPIPLLTFYRILPAARLPTRAGRSAGGHLPQRAYRYCEAVTTASAFGWWLYAPMDFRVLSLGGQLYWSWGDRQDWLPLGSAQFPSFATTFDSIAPADLKGFSPPFLTALPEPNLIQIWTGLFVRTAPGWSLLIRPPVNFPPQKGYRLFEGLVETDLWFGPLFVNLQLMAEESPILFSSSVPLIQAQPLSHTSYDESTFESVSMLGQTSDMTEDDWADYRKVILRPRGLSNDRLGAYAVAVRRRRKADRQ